MGIEKIGNVRLHEQGRERERESRERAMGLMMTKKRVHHGSLRLTFGQIVVVAEGPVGLLKGEYQNPYPNVDPVQEE